jgi:hypothetical protein
MTRWRAALAALTVLGLGLVPPALAQTWTPAFDLIVAGTIFPVTHDQAIDYGSQPPNSNIAAQLHNGPSPECAFTATRSDTGATQYRDSGGSNGYDSSGQYTDPPPVPLPLPVPVVWTLTLACGQAGTVKATVSTELPPPPPPPAVVPGTAAPRPPAVRAAPAPSPKPTPSVLGYRTAPGADAATPPALVPAATPIVVDETPTAAPPTALPPVAAPSSVAAPRRRPSPSPSRSHLAAPPSQRRTGPNFLRFSLVALGAIVALIVILYASGLRWVRVDDDDEAGDV